MRLDQLIADNGFSTFLLDASGVLYNEMGVVREAVEAVSFLQKRGSVFLVTNNSCHSPEYISEMLASVGYMVAPETIFSSGFGLSEDAQVLAQIRGKKVFWIGLQDALYYLELTGFSTLVSDISLADIVVMASSIGIQDEAYYADLAQRLAKNPKPVVCCNPDFYIRGEGKTLIPVTGYYASFFEKVGVPVFWIGKPLRNYSELIRRRLEKRGIGVDSRVCFFDDNPDNVVAMQDHLGISGCWIRETGIAFGQEQPKGIRFSLARLGI